MVKYSILFGGIIMSFKEISIKEFVVNPITMFSDDWMLLTAGDDNNGFNTMTVSWGHIGAIWAGNGGSPTVVAYSRPQRYTKDFLDSNEFFTLSVLGPEHREALTYLGTVSGRDEDKVSKAGLTPVFDQDTTYFGESSMVFVCRKLYQSRIKEEGFVDKSIIEKHYPEKDFHEMYVGEILSIMVRE